MSLRFGTLALALIFLTGIARPASADDGPVFWDGGVASAVHDSLSVNEACQPTNPYMLYRQTCVGNSLNITLERDPFDHLTFLDHFALFVNKYKDLNTTQQIMPGIRFKMGINLSNVYQQEAVLHARLRIRW